MARTEEIIAMDRELGEIIDRIAGPFEQAAIAFARELGAEMVAFDQRHSGKSESSRAEAAKLMETRVVLRATRIQQVIGAELDAIDPRTRSATTEAADRAPPPAPSTATDPLVGDAS